MRYLAKAFLFVFLTTISSSVTSASETNIPEKCNFAPTSKITNTPTGLVFRSGSQVQFSGTTSTPNNCSGSITEYRWKIEGVYSYSSTKSHTFTLPAGVHEQTYSVELRVRNNINLYNTKTITVTVKRPQRVYHLKDHIGNVRTSVDVEGNVLGHDDYYAFGLSMPGSHSSNTSNPNDNYKFTGHERDDEAGLTIDYMKARNYDPVIGRFQQVDPLAQKFPSNSPYNYALNNPIMMIDPDGREATNCCRNAGGAYNSTINTMTNLKALSGDKDAQKAVILRTSVQAGIVSTFLPGPEDVALGVFMATKAGQALGRMASRFGGAVKGLFKSGDEVVDNSLDLSSAVADVMGDSYKSAGEVTTKIKNEGLLDALNSTSEGDWVKVYEAGLENGKKIETHYFRNNDTNEVFDVKKKYDKWHQKEFKNLDEGN